MKAVNDTRDALEDHVMWEVFARRKHDEPLYHLGTLASDDPGLAVVYARTIYSEFTWVEMVLYPRASRVLALHV